MLKNPAFLCRIKIPYQQLLIFLSFINTFLKATKQPFRRGVILNYVFFSTLLGDIV